MPNAEHIAAALDALRKAGLLVDSIDFDGQLHRVPTLDKPNGKNGAYIAYGDAPTSLWWCDWASGESGVWTAKGESKLTAAEREALSRRMEETRRQREVEQARVQAEAAAKAQSIYTAATDCTEHPYLIAKGVKPVHGLRVSANPKYDNLIVPARNEQGALAGLQFISPDGGKKFLTGTTKKGCFFPIGGQDKENPLLICEGLATGLSLHECKGFPVLVAFDAGNLLPVAEIARARYPEREIILAADNDAETDGNPGVTKATAAALAVNGYIAVPKLDGLKVDWNDLHRRLGVGEVVAQFMNHKKPEPAAVVEGEKEQLPPGFSLRTGGSSPGLWHTEVKENSDPVETWVGPALHVLGATRDEHGNAWGLLLEWDDPDGRRHTWAMPKALLVGKDNSAWLGRLADEGWSGAPGSHARKLLALYLSTYRTKQRALCVPCTGWHHGAFVLPDTIIQNVSDGLSPPDVERIVLQVQTAHNPFRMAGTLEGWKSTIGELSRGNSRLMLAVCASLAAPLLHVAGQESGGFNWTGQSSTGKTTALVAAGSIWGKGASSGGYVQNWRATSNGLEGLAALHSDAALCLDEIGQAPGRTIMEAAYMLANGMGKSRAFQDGSARAAKSWRCMVLSTGEKGLAEKIAEEGGKVQAGQAVRLIDVPADAGAGLGIFEDLHGHESPQAFADVIKRSASDHYGHTARAFIGKIQEDREGIQGKLYIAIGNSGKLFCPDNASGQVQRSARRFALCAAAGEMAAEWGLLPWGKSEALKAVKTCFEAWLVLRGGAGAAEDTAIVEQVTLFIEQHGASRFQEVDNPAATCINRVGFRKTDDYGNTLYYVLQESFKEVCKGYRAEKAGRVLRDAGLLQARGDRCKTWLPALPGLSRQAGYTLLLPGAENAPHSAQSSNIKVLYCVRSGKYLRTVRTMLTYQVKLCGVCAVHFANAQPASACIIRGVRSVRCVRHKTAQVFLSARPASIFFFNGGDSDGVA